MDAQRCSWRYTRVSLLGGLGLLAATCSCATQPPAEPGLPSQAVPASREPPSIAEAPPDPAEAVPIIDAGQVAPAGPRDLRNLPAILDPEAASAELDDLERLIKAGAPDATYASLVWRAALLAQALAVDPRVAQPEAARQRKRAMAWLDAFADNPKLSAHIAADEALYMLAVLTLATDPPVGQRSLHALIMRYPASDWVGPAYLAFGELYFEQRDQGPAIQLFEKAYQMSKPDRAYVLAMQGTCLLFEGSQAQAQPAKAMAKLVQAWTKAGDPDAVRDPLDAARVRGLVEQAIVPAYIGAGRPDKARQFFTAQLDGAAASRVLRALAAAYTQRGDPSSAAQVCAGALDPAACVAG